MRLLQLIPAALLVTPALAQAEYTFDIDTPNSAFTWTGDTSLGPINGVPDNNFALVGTLRLEVGPGAGQALGTVRLVEGDALVSPDIQGEIPNFLPILPPLATIEITGLRLSASSPTASVGAGGAFSTDVTLTVLSGTVEVVPLGGTPATTDLTGSQSDPTPIMGTLVQAGSSLVLDAPISSSFTLDDGMGLTADLTLDGTLAAEFDCPAPASVCTSSPNSVGAGAVMSFAGSTSQFANDFELTATGLPAGQPGIFYFGPLPANQPFGAGVRCVGGQVVRLAPSFADMTGTASRQLDLTNLPIPAGETRFYQYWYRDPAAGGSAFNLSDALEIFVCP